MRLAFQSFRYNCDNGSGRGRISGNLVYVSRGIRLWLVLLMMGAGAVRWVLLLGLVEGRRWIQGSISRDEGGRVVNCLMVSTEHRIADIEDWSKDCMNFFLIIFIHFDGKLFFVVSPVPQDDCSKSV